MRKANTKDGIMWIIDIDANGPGVNTPTRSRSSKKSARKTNVAALVSVSDRVKIKSFHATAKAKTAATANPTFI